ncbi:MAG: zf-HC2 domain-containing protein [Candidatus Melainabacteria bacterium]|nr:zf-HC2 domain-containing protein [Candidatus Melainabacteria bacterium]
MDCDRARPLIGPGADNELPVADSALLGEHLEHCPDCRAQWDAVLELRKGVKEVLKSAPPPADIESKLIANMQRESPGRRFRRPVALIAAAAVAGLLFVLPGMMTPDTNTPEINQASKDTVTFDSLIAATGHGAPRSASKEFEVVKQVAAVDLQKASIKAGFTANLEAPPSYTLGSIDLIKVQGRPAAVRLCFICAGHGGCVDCYQTAPGLLAFDTSSTREISGKSFRVAKLGKRSVVIVSKDGLDRVYTSMMPGDDLLRLVAGS